MTRLRSALLGLLLPILLIVWWELQGSAGRLPDYLPPPSLFMREWLIMAVDGSLLAHTLASLWRAMAGFVIGATCGALAWLMAAALRPVETFYEPIIALTYPIPKIAALPIIFAWFGLGDLSKIVIICVSVFYPLYIAMLSGAKATPRAQIWAARNMGAGPMRIVFRVLLPSALPQLFDGLRIGLALSFVVMFVAELMSSSKGLGYLIVHASDNQRFDLMFVSIVTIGMIGFIADRLLLAVRRRALVGQLAATEFRR
jgi:ABC-type nitrate/sulfonate/bicarbonate transport system permease component